MSLGQLVAVVVLAWVGPSARLTAPVDYGAIFEQGISYEKFLKSVRARRDEWRERSRGPGVMYDIDMRKPLQRRRLLIVTEDWCSDSVNTIPYIYLQYVNHPGVTMRIVDSGVGRPVMEAHRTPDDRAATPTVVVLNERNEPIGVWVERPAELQGWYLEQQKVLMRHELLERKMAWYAKDAGRSTIKEIMALFASEPSRRPPGEPVVSLQPGSAHFTSR